MIGTIQHEYQRYACVSWYDDIAGAAHRIHEDKRNCAATGHGSIGPDMNRDEEICCDNELASAGEVY